MRKLLIMFVFIIHQFVFAQELDVRHGYVDNDGVRIHFVEKGEGPLMIMLHGFPDFWYGWYPIMNRLAENYKVVAMDLRGYNQSDAPDEVNLYDYDYLLSDITKVIDYYREEKAIIVGHDWGAALGWRLAMFKPEYVKRFVALNIPHLKGTAFALAKKTREEGTNYTERFFQDGFDKNVTIGWFTRWGIDSLLRPHYVKAYNRSNIKAMLNYYKANFLRPEELKNEEISFDHLRDVEVPVFIIHARDDPFISIDGLNDNWLFNKSSTAIYVMPEGGHFFHHKKPKLVSDLIDNWLKVSLNNVD